jgi:2'-hydroxyisoflavone reductase
VRLLVLGGTSFVGRHLVLAARAAGLDVTLFNRGQTNQGLFSDLDRLVGDRERDLSALRGRRWDAVLDVNGYIPRVVGATAAALGAECEHYTYISTVSVYGMTGQVAPNESHPVTELDSDTEEVTGETYGALKARCEDTVRERFGDRALIVRPGVVVGPYDPTERFVRWVRRAADGDEMLAPGDPAGPMQFIDARDLADWTVRMLMAGEGGTFNAVRPHVPMAEMLEACIAVTGAGTTLTWVAEDFLPEHEVTYWSDLPIWLPREHDGMLRVDPSAAVAAGLTFRPLEDTVRATWLWDRARADCGPAGLSADREREVLAAWHAAAAPRSRTGRIPD